MNGTETRNSSGAWKSFRSAAPVIGAAVPVVLVNTTAFIGQFAWTLQHVPWIIPGQVLFSATLESVAVYLAWHAHKAQLANDSAGRLRFSAYLFALIIGAMNYSHYAIHWQPNALAVGLGLMSALSPWLWGIHSRRASRDQLMAQNLIEGHAIRLGANRVMWHPFRSAVVMSRSAWTGERDPKRAITDYEARRGSKGSPEQVPAGTFRNAGAVEQIADVPALAAGADVPAHDDRNASAPAEPVHVPAGTPLTGTSGAQAWMVPLPGTTLNGATVNGNANLAAEATISKKSGPSDEILRQVKDYLAATPLDALPAQREVARRLGSEDRYRRLAARLLAARTDDEAGIESAGVRRLDASPSARTRSSSVIATPAYSVPGGIPANG